MDISVITKELDSLIEDQGVYPYKFFNILRECENSNLDIEAQNKVWEDLKQESWHSLNLKSYMLWSISDNGDLLWWNGSQTVAMNPRSSEFMSLSVSPKQFIKLVGMGKVTGIFPESLWAKNA